MSVTVCVVSLPERHTLLAEALASVRAQTLQPDAVLIGVDPRVVGEAANMNRLVRAASTEWVAFLHDDDLWDPGHLAAGSALDCDVAVASFRLVGRPESSIERHHCDYDDLRHTNWFPPSTVMARREQVLAWGGFAQAPPGAWVDWTTWRSWLAQGARFACTHEHTVSYRFGHGYGNGSWAA
jgi:glycosyltransferase involved in cell wall biosynthesis